VRDLVGDGVTVLLTTQYLEEADQLADDVVVIDRGRVAATGTPDQLKAQVGRQVLYVRPAREGDLDTVAEVVADLSGAAPDRAGGAVSAWVGDPALPPAVLQRLSGAGVPVAELALRKPSLDEVFFTLTGHRGAEGAGLDETDRSAA
jgi:oleandomycin transport system ATP-binding protein